MDYIITTDQGGEYLSHHGVLGMKWGHRKSKYDKDMLESDTNYIYKKHLHLNASEARSAAKKTQKRMQEKGESHEVARYRAGVKESQNHNRRTAIASIVAIAALEGAWDPNVRSYANKGAWYVGRTASNVIYRGGRIINAAKKVLDPNMIKITPVAATRGREIVGLLVR